MATRPRRRWLRRLGKTLLAVVLFGAVLVVGLQTDVFSRQAARVLEQIIEAQTGERAIIGGVRVDLLGRRATVDGLALSEISSDPDKDGQTILAVDRVLVVIGWRAGAPNLRLLEVVRPTLRLHLDADGLREFRELPASPPADPDAPPPELPWERLRVVDASVSLLGPRFSVQAESLYVSPDAAGLLDVEIGRLALQGGSVAQIARDVKLRKVSFSPSKLEIPALSAVLWPEHPRGLPVALPGAAPDPEEPPAAQPRPSLSLEGAVSATRGGPLTGDLRVAGDLGGWNAALPDNLALEGQLRSKVTLSGTSERPLLGGDLALLGARLLERGRSGALYAYDPGEIQASWGLDGRVLSIAPLRDELGGGVLEVSATLDLQTLGFSASVTAESLSFAEVLVAANGAKRPWIDFRADLETQLAGTLDPLLLAGSFDVALIDLLVRGGPVDDPRKELILDVPAVYLDGEIRVDDRRVRLDAYGVHSGRSHGRATASIGLGRLGPLDLDVSMDPIDLSLLHPLSDVGLQGVGRLDGKLYGPYDDLRAEGRLRVEGFEVLGIPFADVLDAELESDLILLSFPRFQAIKGRSRYSGSVLLDFHSPMLMETDILLADMTLADLTGMFLDIPGLDGKVEGTLSLSGEPYWLDGEADLQLADVDLWGERFETGSARGWMDHGQFTLANLVLEREGGAESVLARGTVGDGWVNHFDIVSSGLLLERMMLVPDDVGLRGKIGLDIQVDGTLFEPEPRGKIALRDTWLLGQPVEDSALRFHTDEGVLSFTGNLAGPGLAVAGTLGLWDQQPYVIRGLADAFPIHAVYPVGADGSPIDARVSGRVDLSGFLGEDPTPVDIAAVLDRVELAWADQRLSAPAPWRYTQHGLRFQLDEIALVGGSTDLRVGGWRAEDGRVAFAGGGTLDLDLLRAVVPDLTRAEGVAEISLSAFGGPGDPPRPVVDVRFSDALLRGDWFPHPFENVSATLSGTADGYEIGEASGRLGGGEFTLSGRIDADGWSPTRFDLGADVQNARIQYLDYLPPVQGDAQLSFDGPSDALLMSGIIDVRSMIFSERIDWEEWVLELADSRLTSTASEATANYFALDLTLRADQTLRVRNNVGDLTGSAELHVIGDTSRTGLVGTVRMDPGGRVYFKEREFELSRGEIRFNEPYTYDPDLDIALLTSVRSREQEYDIDLRVSGPYSAWNTTANASPSLPQADINALLLFGMTQEELERYGGLSAALALEGGDLLASRFGLLERVGSGVFKLDIFRLDRVDLVSGVSERGRGLVSSEIRFLAEKDLGWDTTLILEQNLSRTSDTYIGFDKQLARTLYTRAYWASQQYGRSLPIGGAYGLDVNLRWELD